MEFNEETDKYIICWRMQTFLLSNEEQVDKIINDIEVHQLGLNDNMLYPKTAEYTLFQVHREQSPR